MRHYSKYTQEFREDAVALLAKPGRSIRSVADDLGVNHWTLRDWYNSATLVPASGKAPRLFSLASDHLAYFALAP